MEANIQDDISSNIQIIQQRIAKTCERSNRNLNSVKLLLATKTVPADRIKLALQSGGHLIAENKVQELQQKYIDLQSIAHTNHFIGHLQRNKIKELLKYDVSCIQSIDQFDLAEKLNQRLALTQKQMDILIQVNTSNEDSKFGVQPEAAEMLIRKISKLEHLHIKGLMTIGLFSSSEEKVRACFRLLANLSTHIGAMEIPNVQMKELSMGMSGDLEIAIEEGATIVRVGTAVFGKRSTSDQYYWPEP